MGRKASFERKTKETDIKVELELDGAGKLAADTGFGFFDHMLAQLACHSLMDISAEASGDTETGFHHLCEDVGICLGRAFRAAIGQDADGRPLRRFGSCTAPMDGSLARAAVDISGRGGAYLDATAMDEDIAEFLKAFAREAGIALHLDVLKSDNRHHAAEACFKALAVSLRAALEPDSAREGSSSSKGCIG